MGILLRTLAEDFYSPEVRVMFCRNWQVDHWAYSSLAAAYWRLYYNPEPGAQVEFQGRKIQLYGEKIFLIAPDTDCSCQSLQSFEHFFIHFHANPPYDFCRPGIYSFEPDAGFMRRLNQCKELLEFEDNSRHIAMLALSLCVEALLYLPEDALGPEITDARVLDAIRYMTQNLGEKISNTELARKMNMNTNSFINLFKRCCGMPPQKFLNRKRIQLSSVYLRRTGKSIEEIADVCGFCDRYHFSKSFRNVHGMGPGEFRKNIH